MSKGVKKVQGVPGGPEFVVERGIPVPPPKQPLRGPRGSIYPLEKLVEGDSFAVPVKDLKKAAQKRSYLSALGKSRGIKVETRYLPEEGVVRCWHRGLRPEMLEEVELIENAPGPSAGLEDYGINKKH